MRIIAIIIVTLFTLILSENTEAQELSVRTEYIGNSGYYYLPPGEKPKEKIGDAEGSAMIYRGSVKIPLSVRQDAYNRPQLWGMGISGAYAKFNNDHFTQEMVSEIMNLELGFYHARSLSEEWSLKASLGMGVFMPSTDLSGLNFRNVLFSGGVVFIRHLNPNLDIGGGVAINSSLGYPMIFPAIFVRWELQGKYDVNIELVEGLDASISYDFNEKFTLAYAVEMNGQVALLKRNCEDMIFSHQYIVTGFRPEFKIGDSGFSVMGMAGLNLYRPASFSERSLKGVFSSDNDYYFSISPYVSIGLKMKF
ncbi:DUF6268 family outer membrane beta-barrel protein [Galbibacter sp.]|uniref:DUF6268 family outer membrane beta-barrel protein n=1 Tax=Galbibacter sp. TaxID=2918471 RepID=UPI003A95714A